jgi:hypothetical protein
MTRLRAILCAVALPIVVWSFAGIAAAAEPESQDPKLGQLPDLGGFDKSIPLAIGGGITVGVLVVGFFLLNLKKPQPRTVESSFNEEFDPRTLPPPGVGSPNPLRYFAMPVLFVALIAVFLPLGYSVWKSLPDTDSVFTPTKLQPVDFPKAPFDLTDFKIAPLPPPPTFDIKRTIVIPVPAPPRIVPMQMPPPIPIPGPPRMGR